MCVCVICVYIYDHIYVYQFFACTIMLTFRSDSISELLRPVIRKGSPFFLPLAFLAMAMNSRSQLLLQFSRFWINLYVYVYIYIIL